MGNHTIRRYSLVKVGMDLIEMKCVTVEAGFEIFCSHAMLSVTHTLLLLPSDQDIELLAPSPAPGLPEYHGASHPPPSP